MASLKEVAKLAGVSLMTVSRALNCPEKLSEETYKHVKKAIDELNYVPNFSAKNIRGSTGKTIGILSLGTATTPFSVEIILAIEKTVRQHGWHSFVINTFEDDEQEMEQAAERLLSYRPAGIIIARNGLQNVKIPRKLHNIPIVLSNCVTNDIEVASYIPNDFQGQFDLTEQLVKKGYKKALCMYIPEDAIAAKERKNGFEKAWFNQLNSQTAEQHFMIGTPHTYENGAKPLQRLLESNPKKLDFDVVVCGNDRIAFLTYQLLLSRSFRIPEDVAVVGYDNMIGVTHLFQPSLTTVQLPHYEMGKQAALHFIEDRKTKEKNLIKCPLIIGQSC
ncbi:LacI family DNA-binding transcriptional regulator [Phocoenobacter skyensis]|uniref:DNA-binding transcriptional regulator, LacI/PurR family n=1 Tax=Phocoenobacter skyensis TaxID=97481 RepID=A0A1H7VXC4_9PAST|nr:LacI family DNA-binding transcriptional regulator [Pasteurella skyensis]MDP8079051.1 LacI family DNA-binding transcriptional regulator [Pasteurella skyensis]MDP8085001.1 LacI family DNA-binding transcriptional regulator [Pasteurella skyensis]MDP8184922.1 LacI family DNA-binding transcriptional regulator [Pasteurella skyensis]QLB21754.1 transcriptional regulator [Pasteurella skyensis]SEM13982.1 DNA-binding transcriptional regulator, LacI/PurR family [Pasteurella skyensis]